MTAPTAALNKLVAKWRRYAEGNFDDAANARSRCAGELEQALAALPASGWRPIETAPKDGTHIVAVVAGFVPAVARWTNEFRPDGAFEWMDPEMFAAESHWEEVLEITDPWEPTHWMPLPAAPTGETK